MLRTQKGFTLIELVMIIVILGILAAVAVPRYIDMQSDAALASANGVYGGVQSTASINLAKKLLNKPDHVAITTIATLISAMESAPAGWTVAEPTLTKTMGGTPYTITLVSGETTTQAASFSKNW